ncbi:MAG: hypothetical protein V4582_03365 [Pseudomonadota bacterium]
MSARLLRLALLAQALLCLLVAYAAMHAFGVASGWLALAIGAAVVLLARLAITANNFASSARHSSATPAPHQLGARAGARLFIEEFIATLSFSSWNMARARPGQRIHAGSAALPVLLVHGYGCNGGYWDLLRPRLDAARISHAWIDLEPLLADIDSYVPALAGAVDALCRASGAGAVIIVSHSMGGLAARAYLRQCGGADAARVAHLITLGTPHHGTCLAKQAPGQNALQMRWSGAPGQEPAQVQTQARADTWLGALAASESAHTRARITSIFSHHDNIVAPQTSARLPGASNIELGGVGHVALGRNARVLACVMAHIAAVPAPFVASETTSSARRHG